MNKTILFGGSGHLGSNILKNLKCISPRHNEIDLSKYSDMENNSIFSNANTVIHSAGYVNTEGCEDDPNKCLENNVMSTYNLVKICRSKNIKLIYISSEYVFDGESSEYRPSSPVCPKNIYGLCKASSEFLVKTLKNYLIIRAPFIRTDNFIYPSAFKDQYTVRQYVGKVAKDIARCITSGETGIKHIVGKYQSVYDLAKKTNPNVVAIETPEHLEKILPMKLNLVE